MSTHAPDASSASAKDSVDPIPPPPDVSESDDPLPDFPSEPYTLYKHLMTDQYAKSFHSHVIKRVSREHFDNVRSIVEKGVSLAADVAHRVFPDGSQTDAITTVLTELAGNTTLPFQPDGIDVRKCFDQALALITSTKEQADLHAEYKLRLGIFFDYVVSLPQRLQTHRPSMPRPVPSDQQPHAPRVLPQRLIDTRDATELRRQTLHEPNKGMPPQCGLYNWSDIIEGKESLSEKLVEVVGKAYSLAGMDAHETVDSVWTEPHTQSAHLTYGSEYMMRIVLWCVSMYWAAMVWRGSCAVCGTHLTSWHSHTWQRQIVFSTKASIAEVIDHWWSYRSNNLFSILFNVHFNCSRGKSCCAQAAALIHVFGATLPTQGATWPQPGGKTLHTQAQITDKAGKFFDADVTPPTTPVSHDADDEADTSATGTEARTAKRKRGKAAESQNVKRQRGEE